MIRGVVIHLMGEQPLLADLEALPTPTDACLVCTNLRLTSGLRPAFVHHTESTFLFPLVHVRFVEIPPGVLGEEVKADETVALSLPEPELDLDEDLLRRVREA